MSGKTTSEEVLGEQTIEIIVAMYEKAQRQQPDEEPHIWLGNVWLGRAQAMHGVDLNEPGMLKIALYETFLCSCVESPFCARALGLYFLFKEQAQIIERYPKFAVEFDELISPVVQAKNNGTIEELYRKHNPNTAAENGVGYTV
ncbi:MAG: hypothetical protein V2I35_01290 [Desulfocapsaceae bacterium]|jgi:hypothetical protein|nr:hypothetical protein [Desulfocapsaceae bacterium]